jgi:RHS repeat-associated protein
MGMSQLIQRVDQFNARWWSHSRRMLVLLLSMAIVTTTLAVIESPVAHAVPGRSVMLVVDTSGSMSGTPLEQAKAALTASVDALDADDSAGLRAYGGSCGDGGTVLEAPATGNRTGLRSAIDGLTAGGGTPTPDALEAGVGDFPSSATSKVLILVSDGQSTCGDPCPVAQQIAQTQGVNFKAYTVGFNAPDQAEGELQCIARVTGGTYFPATDTMSLQNALNSAIGGNAGSSVPSSGLYGTGNPASNASVACSGDPVNCATGNFTLSAVDQSVAVRGPGLALERSYNSLDAAAPGLFGHGWSSTYGMRLTEAADGSVTILQENGSQVSFTASQSGYTAPDWVLATLAKEPAGGWTFTRRKQTMITFDAKGRLTAIADLNGEKTTASYDAAGRLEKVSASGRHLSFTVDTDGRVTRLRGPGHRTTRYSYDSAGNLASVTDPGGGTTSFRYDADHRLTRRTDPTGAITTNTYDSAGRVAAQTDALGATTRWEYSGDTANSSTKIIGADGRVVEEKFAGLLLVSRTVAAGTPYAATTSYVNESQTKGVSKVTDALGRTVSTTYDANGNPIKVKLPDDGTLLSTYDELNNPTSTTDASGATITMAYDERGNLTSMTAPTSAGDATTKYRRTDAAHPGDLTASIDPEGRTTTYRYSSHGDLIRSSDPLKHTTRWRHNASGELAAQIDAAGHTTWMRRDKLGRVVRTTDPSGTHTTATYDAASRLIRAADQAGKVTRYRYDKLGHTTSVRRADGSRWLSAYDSMGELIAETDPLGRVTRHHYDPRGLPIKTTSPGNRTTELGYDAAGQLATVTDPAGRATKFAYTTRGDIAGIDYSDATPDVKFSYDDNGRRTAMADGTGTSRYDYDASGQLTSYTTGAGHKLRYTYDRSGLITSLTYPNGKKVSRGYDPAGRQANLTDWRGKSFTFGYNAVNLLTRQTAPNRTTTRYTYTADDLLKTTTVRRGTAKLRELTSAREKRGLVKEALTTPGVAGDAAYRYDAVGQLIASYNPTGRTRYRYDQAGELTGVRSTQQSAKLAYTTAGELETMSATSNRGTITASYGYDKLGERTSASVAGGAKGRYSYDQAGNLTGYKGPLGGAGLPSVEGKTGSITARKVTASYTYDGDGLRASKTVNGKTTKYTYDPLGGPAALLTDGSRSYVHGPNGAVLEQIDNSAAKPKVLYLHQDHLGSTRLITDSRGRVQRLSYSPYGQVKISGHSSQPAATSILYAGGYRDAESGLYYLINRYYDPKTAQFLSIDPLLQLTGHAYAYAGNNPSTLNDPAGLWPNWRKVAQVAVGVAAGVAIGACVVATAGICGGVVATLAISATVGAAAGVATYALEDTCHTGGGYVASGLLGGVSGLLGAAGGYAIGAVVRGVGSQLDIAGARFAQKTFSERFSAGGRFAGQTVDDVANQLRSGSLSAKDVPIDVIVRDGKTLILNTRSAQALTRADIPRSQWNVVNRTGDEYYEARLSGQLNRNGLDSSGTAIVLPQ